jgi:hypothetical protein
MVNVPELMHTLAGHGVTFRPDGCGGLIVRGHLDRAPADLLATARANKPAILAELDRHAVTVIPVPPAALAGYVRPVTDPGEKPDGAIWFCATCGWPRSTGPDPCPTCGGRAGIWLTQAEAGARLTTLGNGSAQPASGGAEGDGPGVLSALDRGACRTSWRKVISA